MNVRAEALAYRKAEIQVLSAIVLFPSTPENGRDPGLKAGKFAIFIRGLKPPAPSGRVLRTLPLPPVVH
jgi:hypothetical protein